MLSVNNLSIHFGGRSLFDEIGFLVNSNDKIGLTGKNGAGKSTLLKVLAGVQTPDGGSVAKPNSFKIGYLPQEMKHNMDSTVFAEAELAFKEVMEIEKDLEFITSEFEHRTDYETDAYMDLITRMNDGNDRLMVLDAQNKDAEIEKILIGLGFMREDFQRQMSEFSGGWRMRVELSKILLQKPDVLLLDEPTNHLDIESIEWLESFLINYSGAVVLISHDRAFLDNVTRRTIEISMGKIYDYKANYTKYLELRKERREKQMAEAKNQEKYIEHTLDLINKYRAKANKASFAQSLIKKLDKLEIVEVDDEDTGSLKIKFSDAPHSGRVTIEAQGVSKSFGDKNILKNLEFFIERGEKIAFVGKNGQGKTTMVKMIVGEHDYEGELKLGHQVQIGYFGQTQAEQLNENLTVFETLDHAADVNSSKNVRNLLGSFLFSGDDIDKKVKVLSGGEKTRLALAQLLLKPYNLLILDEPTNHLDLRSKDVLKKALLQYDGTMLIVSHDRDFLQGLTQKVYEFKDGGIKPFIGDVGEYLAFRKLNDINDLTKKNFEKKPVEKVVEKAEETASTFNTSQKQQNDRESKKIKTAITKVESEIERLEKEIKTIDEKLLDEEQYKILVQEKDFFTKYDALKKLLDEEYKKWETLTAQLSEFA